MGKVESYDRQHLEVTWYIEGDYHLYICTTIIICPPIVICINQSIFGEHGQQLSNLTAELNVGILEDTSFSQHSSKLG